MTKQQNIPVASPQPEARLSGQNAAGSAQAPSRPLPLLAFLRNRAIGFWATPIVETSVSIDEFRNIAGVAMDLERRLPQYNGREYLAVVVSPPQEDADHPGTVACTWKVQALTEGQEVMVLSSSLEEIARGRVLSLDKEKVLFSRGPFERWLTSDGLSLVEAGELTLFCHRQDWGDR